MEKPTSLSVGIRRIQAREYLPYVAFKIEFGQIGVEVFPPPIIIAGFKVVASVTTGLAIKGTHGKEQAFCP
jgi:hypothetical protein